MKIQVNYTLKLFEMKRFNMKRRKRSGGSNNSGSTGRQFTTQPKELGNQINVGKIPLFPPRFRASLRYADTVTLSSTSGAVASYVFSANGLFDPDVTGTGHQPAGFDQMMLSYDHYTVLRARITCTFHNNTSSVSPTAAVSLNSTNIPVSIVDQIMEDGLVTTSRLMPFGVYGAAQTIQRGITVGRFAGVPNVLNDNTYRGGIGSNPTDQEYFNVQIWNTESTTSTSSVDVLIEYDAVFTEPRKLTESVSKILKKLVLEEVKNEEKKH